MDSMALLLLCFIFGFISKKFDLMPSSTPEVLNNFIIKLSLPAVTYLFIHNMEFKLSLLYPVFMPWIIFITAFIYFRILGKALNIPDKSIGCLIMTAGLGNTSFVGFPMIIAFYGAQYIGIGVLCDQPGGFLALSTLGIATATIYSTGSVSIMGLTKKVLQFPPLQAALLALATRSLEIPQWGTGMLEMLGVTITPLAMVSVGYQLRFVMPENMFKKLFIGLSYKLFLAPAFIYVIYVVILGGSGVEIQVTLFEAAMAPMITGGIIAMQYGLDRDLATMMLGVGIPLSFLTLPLWYLFLLGV
jgi:predicted permease